MYQLKATQLFNILYDATLLLQHVQTYSKIGSPTYDLALDTYEDALEAVQTLNLYDEYVVWKCKRMRGIK